jgi:hypothetical protein
MSESSATPHILDSEHDPRILRDLAKLLDSENRRLNEVIKAIQEEKAKLSHAKLNLDESLNILRKKYFGSKSEKSPRGRNRDRLNDHPELTLHGQNLLPPPNKKSRKNLPTEEVIHEAKPEELKEMSESLGLASPSSEQWEEIPGLFDESMEISITERVYKQIRHKRKKYRLKKEFQPSEKQVMVASQGPTKLVPGASYSIEFTGTVVVDKFLNHVPLERQCRIMESL